MFDDIEMFEIKEEDLILDEPDLSVLDYPKLTLAELKACEHMLPTPRPTLPKSEFNFVMKLIRNEKRRLAKS